LTESEVRKQLSLYAEKFDSFQKALEASNDAFAQYKAKIDLLEKGKMRSFG
jgi:hypothetical protein